MGVNIKLKCACGGRATETTGLRCLMHGIAPPLATDGGLRCMHVLVSRRVFMSVTRPTLRQI